MSSAFLVTLVKNHAAYMHCPSADLQANCGKSYWKKHYQCRSCSHLYSRTETAFSYILLGCLHSCFYNRTALSSAVSHLAVALQKTSLSAPTYRDQVVKPAAPLAWGKSQPLCLWHSESPSLLEKEVKKKANTKPCTYHSFKVFYLPFVL